MKLKIKSLEELIAKYKQQQVDDQKIYEQLKEKMFKLDSLEANEAGLV